MRSCLAAGGHASEGFPLSPALLAHQQSRHRGLLDLPHDAAHRLLVALGGLQNIGLGLVGRSDLEQAQREEVMLDFKNNKVKILVATDIVARGIDIEDIGLVLNYDVPHDPEDYIHRIGRTGRAKRQGVAVSFVADFPSKIRIDDIAKNTRNEILPVKFDENGSLTMA